MNEMLVWTATSASLPDDESTVLMWVKDPDGTADWFSGWRDGDAWRDCATGDVVAGEVTHWAQPEGPGTC